MNMTDIWEYMVFLFDGLILSMEFTILDKVQKWL
jgi:hypothetical protein